MRSVWWWWCRAIERVKEVYGDRAMEKGEGVSFGVYLERPLTWLLLLGSGVASSFSGCRTTRAILLDQTASSASAALVGIRVGALLDWSPHAGAEVIPRRLAIADEPVVSKQRSAFSVVLDAPPPTLPLYFSECQGEPAARTKPPGRGRSCPRLSPLRPALQPYREGRKNSRSRSLGYPNPLPLQILP